MKFNSVDEVLDFAIEQEEKAARFYTELAGKARHPHMAEALLGFAEEEKGHKAKLEQVKAGKTLLVAQESIRDLGIGDATEEVKPTGGLDYTQALRLAMQAEKAAFRLYHGLAEATEDPALRDVLMGLAQEEAKHKLRFELEYDEVVLAEG
jgi:rubrerythrin